MTRFARAASFAATLVFANAPTSARADPLYGPNWVSGTCNSAAVANLPDNHGWVETTIEGCCERYYGHDSAYNDCVTDGGGTIAATNKWYVDWSSSDGICSKSCEVSSGTPCGGHSSPYTTKTQYDTAAACCAGEYTNSNQPQCEALSNRQTYTGSNKFYVDSTEHLCIQDCTGPAPCGGVVTHNGATFYDSIAECCTKGLPWTNAERCTAQSDPSVGATNKWFPSGQVCKKDCTGTGPECESATTWTPNFYDTPAACCAAQLSYLDEDYCESRSDLTAGTGVTNKWYVNWSNHACSQDCDTAGNAACKKLSSNAILHDTPAACCKAHVTYVDSALCKTASETGVKSDDDAAATSSGKWFADYSSAKRCVRDCPKDAADATCGGAINTGTPYDTPVACCAAKFGWYQKDLCKVLSESGGEGHTDLFYPNQGEGLCHKDCAGTAGACNGRPSDYSQEMYATAEACCTARLGWINKDSCKSKSENGADAPLVGTNKWFVNWQTNMCDQDCPTANGGACRGVSDGASVVMHATAKACCSSHFSSHDGDFCASRSSGAAHSGKFYPKQGEGKCYQDCAGTTAPCNGSPKELSVRMYDTIEACCTGSVGWANKAKCAGASDSDLATDEWYANWQLNMCVKNCPTSSGDGACGGIAESWNQKYANANACCNQSAFAWQKKSDCIKS